MPSEWRGTKLDDVAAGEPEVRVPGGVRFFTLAVRMFGGDDEIIVTVKAANRAQSFTAAARKADDPNNVREVELLRDGDHDLGCSPYGGVMVEEETPVPTGGSYYPDAPLSYLAERGYFAPTIDMCDGSAVWAPGRAEVFTASALESGTPDMVRVVRLGSVLLGPAHEDERMLIEEKKYGGCYEFLEEGTRGNETKT